MLWMAVVSLGSLPTYAQDSASYSFGSIEIHRVEVFDTLNHLDNNILGRFVNSLHILTKENVIRRELLFTHGDPYSLPILEESERNLRNMGIIADPTISVDTVKGHRVNVLVLTQDKWTIGFSASYKQEAGIRTGGFSLSDNNFLGNAQQVSASYNYSSERTNPNGTEFHFTENRLFNSRWSTTEQYKNSEDLKIGTTLIEYPFYSEETNWSGGAYTDDGDQRVRLYDAGTLLAQDHRKQSNEKGWIIYSNGIIDKIRFGFGLQSTRSHTSALPLNSFDNVDLATASVGAMHREYYEDSLIDNFGRTEDISTGFSSSLVLGRNFFRSGQYVIPYFIQLGFQHAGKASENAYFYQDISSRTFTNGVIL